MRADSGTTECISQDNIQLHIQMQRPLCTHLYHSLPTALPSSHSHPHVSQKSRASQVIMLICYQMECCAVTEGKKKEE
uniref:Uncharacterized protein n=1 Tax=Anguilla anguilla TaxID=7936 RepID=A0A0E9S2F4_ANGAN